MGLPAAGSRRRGTRIGDAGQAVAIGRFGFAHRNSDVRGELVYHSQDGPK